MDVKNSMSEVNQYLPQKGWLLAEGTNVGLPIPIIGTDYVEPFLSK